MVKVHVWLPHGEHVGHTALTIGTVYVSFWPDGSAGKTDVLIKRSQPSQFMEALRDDVHNEGDRQPITIKLDRLDEEKMLDFVNDLRQKSPRYQLAQHNCSHVVANCLMAGTGTKPSFTPHGGEYGGVIGKYLGRGIWTPAQVLEFARELQKA
jgi:hypothetical protein